MLRIIWLVVIHRASDFIVHDDHHLILVTESGTFLSGEIHILIPINISIAIVHVHRGSPGIIYFHSHHYYSDDSY